MGTGRLRRRQARHPHHPPESRLNFHDLIGGPVVVLVVVDYYDFQPDQANFHSLFLLILSRLLWRRMAWLPSWQSPLARFWHNTRALLLRERLLKSKAVPEAETLHVSWLNGQKSESFGWMGEWSEHQNMKRFTRRDSLGCQESHLQFCLESSSLWS